MAGGKLLILGGIRSGKSEYAESLLAQAQQVRYIASAAKPDDAAFAERVEAHRFRRPASWETVEAGSYPGILAAVIGKADSQVPILVDDLGGWAANLLGRSDSRTLVDDLVEAVRSCPARLILVSPEVGLSVVPPTETGVAFADLLGELNQAIAAACDEVTLVIAGQPTLLKGPSAASAAPAPNLSPGTPTAFGTSPAVTPPADAASPATAAPAAAASAAASASGEGAVAVPAVGVGDGGSAAAGLGVAGVAAAAASTPGAQTEDTGAAEGVGEASAGVDGDGASTGERALSESTRALPIVQLGIDIRPGMDLPIHDDDARSGAEHHLSSLDIPTAGLGSLARVVVFAAGTQGRPVPQAWRKPHLFLLNGIHEGNVAAGDDVRGSAAVAEAARRGEGPIGLLATENGVTVKVVQAPAAGDIAYGEAAPKEIIADQLREGWRLVDEAVDEGADLIIVGSCGAGAETAAAAVTARITGSEIVALLGRIVSADGKVNDDDWMLRAAAVRDALHRSRNSDLNADTVLAELGGPDLAIIAGILLGATARRTPVLLDGPVGTAAALLARDLGSQSRLWSAIADFGTNPTTKAAADVLGLTPLVDLKAGLGEGALALLALPMLNAALTLAATLPVKPSPTAAPPGFEDFVG